MTVTATSAIGPALTITAGAPGPPIVCRGCGGTHTERWRCPNDHKRRLAGRATAHRVPPAGGTRPASGPGPAGHWTRISRSPADRDRPAGERAYQRRSPGADRCQPVAL